jgi:diaminopimelate decarboxylase
MNHFELKNGVLHAEAVPLPEIARQFGTPAYVYSRAALEGALKEFQEVLGGHAAGQGALVCYAVKANSSLAILNLFARLGAGFDIVSGGELQRALAAGADPKKIVFSGVGKTAAEMRQALEAGIFCFNIESVPELDRLNEVAGQMGRKAPISLRVNPNVDPKTHPYISTGLKSAKFGVAYEDALPLYRRAASLPHIEVAGIDCHIGSQILDMAPLEEALERVLELAAAVAARGIPIAHVDVGGGLGIRYREEETALDIGRWCAAVGRRLAGTGHAVVVEPGRAIVGNAGVLLTRVEYLKLDKDRRFAIVDASMSELIRPALYEAWHEIAPLAALDRPEAVYDVVGPVCESSDVLGTDRRLAIAAGDGLAILSAGAYGMAMSSNYNSRPRPAEVMVDGARAVEVRARETVESLFAGESTLG